VHSGAEEQVRLTNGSGESGSRDEVVVEMQQFGTMKWPRFVFDCAVPKPITAR
jgi:hypothetical protein